MSNLSLIFFIFLVTGSISIIYYNSIKYSISGNTQKNNLRGNPINISPFNVMSFNVRSKDDTLRGGKDGSIKKRAPRVIKTVLDYSPYSIGFQEVTTKNTIFKDGWYKLLKEGLSEKYDSVCIGRDGDMKSESTPIFYNKEKVELIENGTKWLSPTPDEPGSQFPSTEDHPTDGYPRTLIYVILRDKKTNQTYLHINTHLDHKYSINRLSQVKVVEEFAKNYTSQMPVIITGDFNSDDSEESKKTGDAIPYLLENGFKNAAYEATVPDNHWTFPTGNYQNEVYEKCKERKAHKNGKSTTEQKECSIECDEENGQVIDFGLRLDNGRTSFTSYKVINDSDTDGNIASDHYAIYMVGVFH